MIDCSGTTATPGTGTGAGQARQARPARKVLLPASTASPALGAWLTWLPRVRWLRCCRVAMWHGEWQRGSFALLTQWTNRNC